MKTSSANRNREYTKIPSQGIEATRNLSRGKQERENKLHTTARQGSFLYSSLLPSLRGIYNEKMRPMTRFPTNHNKPLISDDDGDAVGGLRKLDHPFIYLFFGDVSCVYVVFFQMLLLVWGGIINSYFI